MKRYMALLICIFMLVGMMPAVALAEGDAGTTPEDVATNTDAYTVTINGGTGSGEYAENAAVTIVANEPETGKQFKEWTGADGLTFTSGSATASTAIFSMPARDVSLTAVYEDIPAVTLQSIEVTKAPNKTVYTEGESFDPAGMVITAKYSDGTSKVVTEYTVSPTGKLDITTTSVTISYTEGGITKTAIQDFIVNPAPAATTTKITISTGKINYGKTLKITVNVDGVKARAASIGKLFLYVNGVPTDSVDIKTLPYYWYVAVTEANNFKRTGENTIKVVYSGADGVESSTGEVVVTVTNYCKPCTPTHYCCGEEHYNGKCVTVRAGEDVTFKVDLRCDETCQWYVDKGDGYGFTKISGATCASLTIKDVTRQQDGYRYRCVIKNCCETVGKPIFTLNVASGQLYTPKTGDSSAITIAAGCAALAALMLVANRREKRAK